VSVAASAPTSPPVLLVPDLALERWPSMDRYALALASRMPEAALPEEAERLRGPRFLSRYVRYPRALRRYHPAVVHVTDHSYAHCLSAFRGVPSVVTIHDLYPVHQVALGARSFRAGVRNRLLRRVLWWTRRADRWIAVSEFTAAEARQLLNLPSDRIRVVPNGVDAAFGVRPADAAVAARRRQWLGTRVEGGDRARIILHVGSCAPRKNVELAAAAVSELRRRGANAWFVQIGGRFTAGQARAIAVSGLEPFVRQEPTVSEADLIAAYHAADALVLPSSYEGFGLPALEALAAGLPVVTSGAPALRETVGDAGLVVDSTQPAAVADALSRLLGDGALRDQLAARGRARAREISWERAAQGVRAVYAELGLKAGVRARA
jgi:glycosyltransferase involved in cell wall biosynthesis